MPKRPSKQQEPESPSKRKTIKVTCPVCGRIGNLYIDKRSYLHVYHGKRDSKDNNGEMCYIGPAREHLHLFITSNPSQSSLLGRRVMLVADDADPAVKAAAELLKSKGYEVIFLGPANSGKQKPSVRGPQQAPNVQQGDQKFASSPDLWVRVFQAEVGEKVICPVCGREGIKRIWKSGEKYHIFIYHFRGSRCYIAPVDATDNGKPSPKDIA